MKKSRLLAADLHLLTVFKTVVDCGGFAPAQVALNSTQPTISNQMAALEAKLGVRLCERGRAGFRVTPQGQAVYESLKVLLMAHDTFGKQVAALSGIVTGDLHVGVIDNTATNDESPLVKAFQKFRARETSVHIHLHVLSPLELQQRVVDRRVELGVGCFPNRAPGLAYRKLFEERHELYCGVGHPLYTSKKAVTLQSLSPFEFVHRGYFPSNHRMLPEGANVCATVSTMEGIAMLVLTGRYLGYLPTHYAQFWVQSGQLREVPLKNAIDYTASFEMIYRRGSSPSLPARAFMADLTRSAK